MTTFLTLQNAELAFGDQPLLDHADLTVADGERIGVIGRNVFWPAPNVDSALVRFSRYAEPRFPGVDRTRVFALIDAAFGQRRKTLHAALKRLVPAEAFAAAGIDPTRRGETLTIDEFARLAQATQEVQA